ncbi:monocarboxylate transporter 5-like [Pecten maximus]|uniref:monocarboxylate transporter 5-like n=1 Tax=Pecten maximus TaxID=6579 RepID=UPI001458CE23|nr:monocarboxylate transporter 5-like [Pecten maximus]
MFDFSLLKSPTMLLYGASCLLVMFGFYIPSNFLPALASDVNLTNEEGAFLILLMGVSNSVTRVVIGYIADKSWANSLIINNSALLVGGVATCFAPFYMNFTNLAVYALLSGTVMGILSDVSGHYNLAFYFGGVTLGLGGLVCLPLRWISEWEKRRSSNFNISATESVDQLENKTVQPLSIKARSSVYIISQTWRQNGFNME